MNKKPVKGRTFVTADPHFLHEGVCRFTRNDGSKLRPWTDPIKMTDDLIENWNSVVHPDNRVYVLGDLAMNRKGLDYALPKLNGRLILVKGNHDIDKLSYYSQYFDDIRAYVVKKGYIMTHIPIHPQSLGKWKINIHGHLHSNMVMKQGVEVTKGFFGLPRRRSIMVPDERYVCVSVEHTNYYPLDLQDIIDAHGPF